MMHTNWALVKSICNRIPIDNATLDTIIKEDWTRALAFIDIVIALTSHFNGHRGAIKAWLEASNLALGGIPLELMSTSSLPQIRDYLEKLTGEYYDYD